MYFKDYLCHFRTKITVDGHLKYHLFYNFYKFPLYCFARFTFQLITDRIEFFLGFQFASTIFIEAIDEGLNFACMLFI